MRELTFEPLAHLLGQGKSIVIDCLWDTPKAIVADLACKKTGKHVLFITGSGTENKLQEDFATLTQTAVLHFPAWEMQISPSPDIVGERNQALFSLLHAQKPMIVLTTLQAILQNVIPKNNFTAISLSFHVGAEYAFDALPEKLSQMGYERSPLVTDKGQFALRGGIIDLFPVSCSDPYRLEFFGDTLESIRAFDPLQQTSVGKVDRIEILPGQETANTASLFDYLGKNTLLVFDDLLALEDKAFQLGISLEPFLQECASLQKLFFPKENLEALSEVKKSDGHISFEVFGKTYEAVRIPSPFLPFEEDLLPSLKDLDMPLLILSPSKTDEATFKRQLEEQAITLPKMTSFEIGYLSSGFIAHSIPIALLPLAEITHRYRLRRPKQRSVHHSEVMPLFDLSLGDLVVHFHHGIGKYLGIEKKPNHQGIQTEYLVLEYAEKAKLYVPFPQSYLVSKYIGAEEQLPTLHALNSNKWKTTRSKTEQAILGYAKDLLELYAKRSHLPGFAYREDSHDMALFEQDFPFVETEDQLSAIQAVKENMCSSKCMDRLVCGDVGYGKTEVAMRAAFKAVVDGGKQVAVLVPTTILAMQHYENFTERMRNFPIRIGVLSRFRTQKQQKQALKEMQEGKIDILIGTHRIISKDVVFKDLGLIIIDEEQRFGVKAKEHLKTLKHGIDCLTLSATPIPRTLYMSLVGARDMSVIATPPQDRLPIKTIVAEGDEELIRTALLRELARDGQVYVIHNRVESIFDFKDKIQSLVPLARLLVVHGQMSSEEIDQAFHAFKFGRADILVATTLVENGIDIPNANTMLVDRADQFGLADLYQLRGRVGRWNRRAFCYFLIPKRKALSEVAKKRLDALAEVGGHGGGMRIAMRDLEIRGAGDILGLEQSGQVSAIGFHLYCKLLKRTIDALQGKSAATSFETKLEFPQEARLPESYIAEMSLRLEIYQRLGESANLQEVDALFEEVKDRFGPLPPAALWLYHLSRIRVFAALNHYTLIKLQSVTLTTERRIGEKTILNTHTLIIPKDPALLEAKIISLLNK